VGILAVCLLLPHLPDPGLNEASGPYLETETHPRLFRPAYSAITEIFLPESSLWNQTRAFYTHIYCYQNLLTSEGAG